MAGKGLKELETYESTSCSMSSPSASKCPSARFSQSFALQNLLTKQSRSQFRFLILSREHTDFLLHWLALFQRQAAGSLGNQVLVISYMNSLNRN